MNLINKKEEQTQKVMLSFKAKAILDFPIDQDLSNLTKEDLIELLTNVYDLIEIKVENFVKLTPPGVKK